MTSPTEPAQDRDILDPGAGAVYLRGGGLRIIAYGGAVAASIAATTRVTRHLHAVGYGRYVTVTSLLLIVAAVTEGGLANLGVREFATGGERERREFMRNLVGLRIALSFSGGGGAIAFAAVAGYPRVVIAGTALASLGLVLANLQVTLAVPLTARLRMPWLAALDFIGPGLTAAVLVGLVALDAPLLPFFAAALAGYAATLIITAALVKREVTLVPAFSVSVWRRLLADSAVFAAATALGAIYFQVVIVAMSLLTNGHQVGVFSVAFRVLSVVNGVPILLVGSAFAILLRAARDDPERLRYALQRLLDGNLLLGGWLSLLVVSAAPFTVKVLGGGAYEGSVGVLRILGLGVGATFVAVVFSFALLSVRMYRALIAINGLMVVLAVVLCVVLIPAHGARGAAVVTLTLEILLAAACAGVLMVRQPLLRPSLAVAARTVVALGAAFAVALSVPLPSALAALAGSAALAVAVALLRAFPTELLEALRGGSAAETR